MLASLQKFCLSLGLNQTYTIAYSGGMDSHVLLHLFSQLRARLPIQLRAVYINHGLSPHADQWALHCKKICDTLKIDFLAQKIQAKSTIGESPEEIARERRYAAFSKLLAPNDFLVTAHHKDDQAETLLIQLFRGAGPKGLSAMPAKKTLGQGFQIRPLLDFTRDDFKAYAAQHRLLWIEDESNADLNFSRNFIRHKVLPVLKERWPSVSHTLTRVSLNCAEAQVLLDHQAEQDLQKAEGSKPGLLSVKQTLNLDPLRQRQLLRYWLNGLGFEAPGFMQLHQIQRDILQARSDKMPFIVWNGVEIRRFRDDLYAMPMLLSHDASQILAWDFSAPLTIASCVLKARKVLGQGLRADVSHVTIRFRQGGEVCRLPGRICHHQLKKLFQEWQIPYWERNRMPLIYVGDELVAVVGFYMNEAFCAKTGELGYQFEWEEH